MKYSVVKLINYKLFEKTCSLYTRANKGCVGKIARLHGSLGSYAGICRLDYEYLALLDVCGESYCCSVLLFLRGV